VAEGGFIVIDRKILEWEWYKKSNTKDLFLHMLWKANWKDGKFQGIDIPRGSFVSSYPRLSDELGLTVNEIRTALKHLLSTGEITVKAYTKFSVFTVNNYCSYQDINSQITDCSTDKPQSNHIQITTIEQRNKETMKQEKKKSVSVPKMYFEDDERLNDVFLDFVEMRKKLKNGAMTERAITMMIKKIKALDRDTAIAQMEQSIVNNWKDLYPLKDNKPVKSTSGKPNQFQNFPQREIDYDALVLQQLQGG
jgi:hypothetical protein